MLARAHGHVVHVGDRPLVLGRAGQHARASRSAPAEPASLRRPASCRSRPDRVERVTAPLSHPQVTDGRHEAHQCDAGNRLGRDVCTACDLPYTRAALRSRDRPRDAAHLRRARSADAPGGRRPLGGTHARQFAVRRGHRPGRRRPRHLPRRPRLRRLPVAGGPRRRPGHGEDAGDRAGGAGGCGGLPATGSSARSASSPSSCSCCCSCCPSPTAAGDPDRPGGVLPGRRGVLGVSRLHRDDAGHPRQRARRGRGQRSPAATGRPSASRTAPVASAA